MQRAKDANAEAIYIWTPGGPQPAAIGKALAERGIDPRRTKVLGQGELTSEDALKNMGEAGLGIITALHYDYNHDSAMNAAVLAAEIVGVADPDVQKRLWRFKDDLAEGLRL